MIGFDDDDQSYLSWPYEVYLQAEKEIVIICFIEGKIQFLLLYLLTKYAYDSKFIPIYV